jgi:hypothetical protein
MDRNAIPIHLGPNVGAVAGLGSMVGVYLRSLYLGKHTGSGTDCAKHSKIVLRLKGRYVVVKKHDYS